MPLFVHRSNRMERLVDILAEVVATPAGCATDAECVVVQGRGMERWLGQELARRLGIWANPDFPFPRRLIRRAFAETRDESDDEIDPYQPETMTWSIAALLAVFVEEPSFAPVRAYLATDAGVRRRVQFAERVAHTFDQYVLYRPSMVMDWERHAQDDWQAVLWRALTARHGSTHIAARARSFFARRDGAWFGEGFPRRVSVFGISSLPPLYVEVLAAIALQVETHLFVLSPSREYWADIRSRREIIRELTRRDADPDEVAAALHLAEGSPLLASLGRLGRDFQQVLESRTQYVEDAGDAYVDPGTATMLATLQSDILSLLHRGLEAGQAPPLTIEPDDRTISIHACHAPRREVEVLHDQLLALFESDPTLQADEVVVMTPAIDTYAPFIDAVFGVRERQIPYRIADRHVRTTQGVVDAFFRALGVVTGRLAAPDVLDLLGLEAIRARFEIGAEDLDHLRRWVREAGIRWGADAAHRQAVGQPALLQNTWRFGLDRLLLGYAMTGAERTLFAGVLPYDDVEGTSAEALGRLAAFYEQLCAYHGTLQAPRSLAAWRDVLTQLLADLVALSTATAHQHHAIRVALATLAARAVCAGFDEAIDLETLRVQLEGELQRGASTRGFLTGGVTFCALVPMRSIPFRVVCLLGMNDGEFPRTAETPGFDRIAQRPLCGDRSRRDDDRYVFLEALLAARERLLITYVGQSIRDGSEIPPSAVVSELLDTLDATFRGPKMIAASAAATPSPTQLENPAVRQHVLVRHPLQAFSPRYFGADGDPRLFSFVRANCEGARSLIDTRGRRPAFLTRPLPFPADIPRTVTVDELARFFENPARCLLQTRLRLWLGRDVERLLEREPLELDTLDYWRVGDAVLRRALQGENPAAAFEAVRATGQLPLGTLGQCTYEDLQPQVEALVAHASEGPQGTPLPPLEVDTEVAGTRVTGMLRDVRSTGQVRCQFAVVGPRHELGLWVRHLVLNCLAPPSLPRDSVLIGRSAKHASGTIVRLQPVADPVAILTDLLDLYWRGLQTPLPFFPRSSHRYVEHLRASPRGRETRRTEQALEAAAGEFAKTEPGWGDALDPYVRQIFATNDLFEALDLLPNGRRDFAATAGGVFDPLLQHRTTS
jgi:exodeoxyribonuclease V gamma subunit